MADFTILNRLIYGTSKSDILSGTAGNDTMFVGAGNDLLLGSAGADIIYGDDAGGVNFIDTISYASSREAVSIDLRQAAQSGGDAEGDKLYSIENVVGSSGNDALIGNDVRNELFGGFGDDRLAGGIDGIADLLDGGAGIDTADYSQATSGMTIVLDQTTMFSTPYGVFSYTADGTARTGGSNGTVEDVLRNMENVTGSAFDDTITGNEKDNVIDGGGGADIINGGGGSDTIDYSRYALSVDIDLMRSTQEGGVAKGDRLISIENVTGSVVSDFIRGDNGGNRLEGNNGHDTIEGRGGNDMIVGGRGADILDGGAGFDVFIYESVNDSRLHHRFGEDTILNFETGIDKIDLRAIDANSLTGANEAFVFTNAFTGSAGQLMYDGATLMGDVNGDKIADFSINVSGLSRSDVML